MLQRSVVTFINYFKQRHLEDLQAPALYQARCYFLLTQLGNNSWESFFPHQETETRVYVFLNHPACEWQKQDRNSAHPALQLTDLITVRMMRESVHHLSSLETWCRRLLARLCFRHSPDVKFKTGIIGRLKINYRAWCVTMSFFFPFSGVCRVW